MPSAIIIGAGVAGLSAASSLRTDGWDVTVIEARDRVGGRLHTLDLAGVPVDLGGSWIHGVDGNPLVDELDRRGLDYFNDKTWEDGLSVYRDGWVGSEDVAASIRARTHFDPGALDLSPNATLAAAIDAYITGLDSSRSTSARFALEALEAPLNIGAAPAEISAAGAARYHLHPGGNLRLRGGYRTLIDSLAVDLDVRLLTPVAAVGETRTAAWVEADGARFEADAVIVTVPLPLLRALTFDPGLPIPHRTAVDRLAMGTAEKIVLAFDSAPWPGVSRRVVYESADQRFPVWIRLDDDPVATVVCFYNPSLDSEIAAMDLSERVDASLAILARVAGEPVAPRAWLASDWNNDRWSQGSYSYFPANSSPEDMDVLASPVSSRLFLAGEHTNAPYFGTVHGAFLSGIRAATDAQRHRI